MPVFLEELMQIVQADGLDGEDLKGWVQIPAGEARSLPKRLYVRRAREGQPVREIHLSGFCLTHPAVTPLTPDEARLRHLGRVRGVIKVGDHNDDDVLGALEAALAYISRAPVDVPAEAQPYSSKDCEVPGPELPDLSRERIVEWMSGRLGYGSRTASAWFLGMEESCEDVTELPSRIEGGDLEDLEDALIRIGRYPDLLADSPPLQRTWAPLIRAWLVASVAGNGSPTTEAVRAYQRREWGRSDGQTLLVELLPLPSPSLQEWPYAGLGLGTRAEYQKAWLEPRIQMLGRLWREPAAKPRVAVAYGRSYWNHYRTVFALPATDGECIWREDPSWAQGYETRGGAVVLVRHPVAFGNSNERWEALGRWMVTVQALG